MENNLAEDSAIFVVDKVTGQVYKTISIKVIYRSLHDF